MGSAGHLCARKGPNAGRPETSPAKSVTGGESAAQTVNSYYQESKNMDQKQIINEIEINGKKYVPKENPNQCNAAEPQIPQNYQIVRCQSAGCFFGQLSEYNPDFGTGTILQARRLWYWDGAASLSQLAVDGTSKPENCKFPVAVPVIRVGGIIEIINCTSKAVKSLTDVTIWKH